MLTSALIYYIATVQLEKAPWRCNIAGHPTDTNARRCCVDQFVNRRNGPPTQHQPKVMLRQPLATQWSTQNRLQRFHIGSTDTASA
ncbi:hypothetical protein PCANC_13500 [Puccinia coronata f. sp. avenae]|uniref:Uncharacterized protein n=1 Tax=Puccinia coronata f. sp. avenae TaxID=200324 RepID=A0A2N5ULX9_9BASI|nr:hypothetical protein PCASD_12593 [Puccinia coronata f. sp. avenae]PLW44962.1 hypothetical protein PCANC_13500 [Puccinia coronata f. sp. avenae]